MTWVEVACGDAYRRWDYAFGLPGQLGPELYPTLVLSCGGRSRVAMMSDVVARDEKLVKSVAVNMARWEDESEDVLAVRLYVSGLISFDDGTSRDGLCLLVVGLDGIVSGMLPIDVLETT